MNFQKSLLHCIWYYIDFRKWSPLNLLRIQLTTFYTQGSTVILNKKRFLQWKCVCRHKLVLSFLLSWYISIHVFCTRFLCIIFSHNRFPGLSHLLYIHTTTVSPQTGKNRFGNIYEFHLVKESWKFPFRLYINLCPFLVLFIFAFFFFCNLSVVHHIIYKNFGLQDKHWLLLGCCLCPLCVPFYWPVLYSSVNSVIFLCLILSSNGIIVFHCNNYPL